MGCGCGNNWGVGCACGGNICGHCDSSAFESSCTDEGQGYPLSIAVGCSLPTGYTPVPGVVATWDGTSWALESDSSSSDAPSDVEFYYILNDEDPVYVTSGETVPLNVLDDAMITIYCNTEVPGALLTAVDVDDSFGVVVDTPPPLPLALDSPFFTQVLQLIVDSPPSPGAVPVQTGFALSGLSPSVFTINFELSIG